MASSISASATIAEASSILPSETRLSAKFQRTETGNCLPTPARIDAPLNKSLADKSTPQCSDSIQAATLSATERPSSLSWRAQSLQFVISPERIPISRACCSAISPKTPPSIPSRTCIASSLELAASSRPSSRAPSALKPRSEGLIRRNHIFTRGLPSAKSLRMLCRAWSCSELVLNGRLRDNQPLTWSISRGSKRDDSIQLPESISGPSTSITGNLPNSASMGASFANASQTGWIPETHSSLKIPNWDSILDSHSAPSLPRCTSNTAS